MKLIRKKPDWESDENIDGSLKFSIITNSPMDGLSWDGSRPDSFLTDLHWLIRSRFCHLALITVNQMFDKLISMAQNDGNAKWWRHISLGFWWCITKGFNKGQIEFHLIYVRLSRRLIFSSKYIILIISNYWLHLLKKYLVCEKYQDMFFIL